GGVDRLGEGVLALQLEPVGHDEGRKRLDTGCPGLTDIDQGLDRNAERELARKWSGLDQIGDVVVKPGRAEADAIVRQRLLEPGVPALAFLRVQVGVGEEGRRKIRMELRQRRRLEAGAVARLELGFAPWRDDGGRQPERLMAAERVIVVAADVRHQEEAL